MSEEEIPPSHENRVPWFLRITYIILIVWGIWAFFAYWDGANGVRGHWKALQKAAKTTNP
ncbi:MAG: hypothetical protein S4CHLAM81_01990 [Chlamydiales bacterium]|nr:hypothetical protein [Chlamydiales bacterium]MCH9634993.1 hypothetical protein [Chlamydiales bacterium]